MMVTKVPSTPETDAIIHGLPKLFVVITCTDTLYVFYSFNGTYNEDGVPMVWDLDYNGAYDEWQLKPATEVTNFKVEGWRMRESEARTLADSINDMRLK